jgi:hypothetical protein
MLNLMGFVLAPKLEKGYHQIWEANLQPLGTNVPAFIGLAYQGKDT